LAKSPCRGFATRNLTGAGLPTPVFFPIGAPARRAYRRALPVMERERDLPVPMSSALIETFAVYLLFGTLALAQVPAAFLFAAPETDPIIRRTAVRFAPPALLSILIEIDYHRRLPPPFPGPSSASQPC